jgi:hypothetical protein
LHFPDRFSLASRRRVGAHVFYFKLYNSQIPVIEQALETAAPMLGSDESRGYMLEMICADFLAGANLEPGNSDILMTSLDCLLDPSPVPNSCPKRGSATRLCEALWTV